MTIRITEHVATAALDHLRPPSPIDLMAHAYKDWLHLNVFVPEAGITALVNASLHGDPLAPSSMAVGTFLVHEADRRPIALVDVRSAAMATTTSTSIGVGSVRVAVDDGEVTATAASGDVRLHVTGTVCAAPIVAETPVEFGRGWIAWRALPRLDVTGTLEIGDRIVDLDDASGYHDHNWGRWCWGDDAGWTWGTLHGDSDAGLVTITVAHRTDRGHVAGDPIARVQIGDVVRDYPARTVRLVRQGRRAGSLPRLPGATAALRADRRDPDLPERITVVIEDRLDHLAVDFDIGDAIQLVNADPVGVGHTFVHELFGEFTCRGRVDGCPVTAAGMGVFEHVD